MTRRSTLPWALALLAPLVAGSLACEYFNRTPGEKLWRKHCAGCHGIDASGNTPQYMGNERADLRDNSWYGYGGDDAGIESTIREELELVCGHPLGPHELHGDAALERELLRLPHLAHPALADQGAEPEVADHLPRAEPRLGLDPGLLAAAEERELRLRRFLVGERHGRVPRGRR